MTTETKIPAESVRDEVKRRVAAFKDIQLRYIRERDENYQKIVRTMKRTRELGKPEAGASIGPAAGRD